MRQVPHRELRNDSAAVLAAVKGGEVVEVTNNGEIVAIMLPPSTSHWDALVTAGKVRRARPLSERPHPRRAKISSSVGEIVDELRGQ